jgi:hypothetical protein
VSAESVAEGCPNDVGVSAKVPMLRIPQRGKNPQVAQEYATYKSWQEVVEGENLRYVPVKRVSDVGTKDRPAYTGFCFLDGLQCDESGRYALAMNVFFQERDVTPTDRGEIGCIDLEEDNKWTMIRELGTCPSSHVPRAPVSLIVKRLAWNVARCAGNRSDWPCPVT